MTRGYGDFYDQFVGYSRRELVAFSIGTARRALPVCLSTGTAGTDKLFLQAIDLLRSYVLSGGGDERSLVERINRTPEASVDDSRVPEFYSMRALSVLLHCLEGIDGDVRGGSRRAAEQLADLYRAFDGLVELLAHDLESRSCYKTDDFKEGPLESDEIQAQQQTHAILNMGSPIAQRLKLIEELAASSSINSIDYRALVNDACHSK